MKITTTVLVSELQAMKLFASSDESRFLLTGICFEVFQHQTLLVAADGRRLSVLRSEAAGEASGAQQCEQFIIPSGPIARLKREDRGRHSHKNQVYCTFDTDARTYELNHRESGYTIHGRLIEGSYPSWRGVLPQGEPKVPPVVGLSLEFMAELRVAGQLLGSKARQFAANHYAGTGGDPFGRWEVQIVDVPNFYHIVMSVKVSNRPAKPNWIELPAPAQVPALPTEPAKEAV